MEHILLLALEEVVVVVEHSKLVHMLVHMMLGKPLHKGWHSSFVFL